MALIKYSMGGQITSVEDNESVEKREESAPLTTEQAIMLICKRCGLQHMIAPKEAIRFCCGEGLKTDELS